MFHTDDDLQIFSLSGLPHLQTLQFYAKSAFQNSTTNRNMVVNEHPLLINDSTSLCYNIIFGADFLTNVDFTLIMIIILSVGWILIFLSAILLNFSHTVTTLPYSHHWYWPWRQLSRKCICWLFCNMHPWCQIWTSQHPWCCLQPTSSLAWLCQNLFNILTKQKNLLLKSILTKMFTLISNQELSR